MSSGNVSSFECPILCLLLGVIGNSCVLFIYIFKMKQHREDRYFIPILALVDLMASMFASIYYMVAG
jgi:hypothetical protein